MPNTPFKVSHIDNIPVITLLVESINARNAHWIKDELLHYVKEHHPKGFFLNLYNVRHIGHIGLGSLIAINNQIKMFHPHAFIGLQPEVSQLIHASHLERVFQIWTGADNCLICGQPNCGHKTELQRRMSEFLSKDHPIDDKDIPHLGEVVKHSPAPPPLDLRTGGDPPARTAVKIGLASLFAFVLIAGISAGAFFTAQNYANRPVRTERTLDEMLVKYDKNQDGDITREDLGALNEIERLALAATPLCTKLGLTCLSTK